MRFYIEIKEVTNLWKKLIIKMIYIKIKYDINIKVEN